MASLVPHNLSIDDEDHQDLLMISLMEELETSQGGEDQNLETRLNSVMQSLEAEINSTSSSESINYDELMMSSQAFHEYNWFDHVEMVASNYISPPSDHDHDDDYMINSSYMDFCGDEYEMMDCIIEFEGVREYNYSPSNYYEVSLEDYSSLWHVDQMPLTQMY
ncbi:hypothetical protein ACFE04_009688 [Oxalis oulophora]